MQVEEEVVVVEDSDDHDGDGGGDGDGDEEMTGMEAEPWSGDQDMGDAMRDEVPGWAVEMFDEDRRGSGGSGGVPSRVLVAVANGREVVPRDDKNGDVVGRKGEGVVKVRVARRLRELYRSAVLVKDRKGRLRRVGGGLVGRRVGR